MRNLLHVSSRYIGGLLLRIAKRLFLLLIGVLLTFVIAWEIFPALNEDFSVVFAILLTYILSAYVVIPAGIRVIRIWYRPNHVPHFTKTPDGFDCDPVNIGIVGTRHQLRVAMRKIGWYEADKKNLQTIAKVVVSFIHRKPYLNAPFSNLYLFGRKQDIGFQKQVGDSYFHRHHVRFWASSAAVSDKFAEHVYFWQKKLQPGTKSKLLWVGAAIKDEGLGFIRYHGQITHSVGADTNAERDKIVSELNKQGLVKEVLKVSSGEEMKISNRVIGDHMISDGELHICVLK